MIWGYHYFWKHPYYINAFTPKNPTITDQYRMCFFQRHCRGPAAAALSPRVANRCLWSLGSTGNPLMMRFKALGVGPGEVVERKNYTPLTVDGRNPAGWWQDFFEENCMFFVEQCLNKTSKRTESLWDAERKSPLIENRHLIRSGIAFIDIVSRTNPKCQIMSSQKFESTLQETNISPKNGILKMIFLFPRWDMLVPLEGSSFLNKKKTKNQHLLPASRHPANVIWARGDTEALAPSHPLWLKLLDSWAAAGKFVWKMPWVYGGPRKKITWNLKNHPLEKENHLNQTIISRFHVNLPGCK